ncbi:hypothetical protein ACFWCB_05450 [Streptomyces sp. NPDC060048]|uniref:hypothetical protein n=1 Tax=unclassified Streptomyces TaxID=2593676 RepID=UPI0036C5C448
MTTMRTAGLALAEVTQHDLDRWLADGRSTRYDVRDFLIWAARRGHSRDSPSRSVPGLTPPCSTRTPTGRSSTSA